MSQIRSFVLFQNKFQFTVSQRFNGSLQKMEKPLRSHSGTTKSHSKTIRPSLSSPCGAEGASTGDSTRTIANCKQHKTQPIQKQKAPQQTEKLQEQKHNSKLKIQKHHSKLKSNTHHSELKTTQNTTSISHPCSCLRVRAQVSGTSVGKLAGAS